MKEIFNKIRAFLKLNYLIILLFSFLFFVFFYEYILNIYSTNFTINILFTIGKYIITLILIFYINNILNSKNIAQRKKAQKKQDEIQNAHKKILQKIKYDYFFYKHEKDNYFTEISESIHTIFGYNKDEFIYSLKRYKIKNLTENVFEKVEPYAKENIIVPPFEVELYAKNGDKIIFEIYETPILNENGEIIAIDAVAHNLHNHVNQEFTQENSIYKTFFDQTNSAIIIMKNNIFVESNIKALEIFDCTIEEITMSSPFSAKFSPEVQPDGQLSKEKANFYIQQAIKNGYIEFEWVHLKKGEKEFIANISLTSFFYNKEQFIIAELKDRTDGFTINTNISSENKKLLSLINNISDGVLLVNFDKEIKYFNKQLSEYFKLGKNIKYLSQVIDNDFFNDKIRGFVNNQFATNSEFDLEINDDIFNTKMIKYEDKEIIIILSKTNNNSIKQNKEISEIIENSRSLLYKLNIDTREYIYMSKSAEQITGYTAQEFLNFNSKQIQQLLHPGDIKNSENIIAKLIKNVENINNESTIIYRFLHKSGEYRWFSDNYKIIKSNTDKTSYILGDVHDITELIKNKIALQESELRFRKTVDNIQNGVSIFENDKIIYVNDELSEITGYSKTELLTFSSLIDIAIDGEKERVLKILQENRLANLEFWIKTKKGKIIYVENRYSESKINEDVVAKYIITTDVTRKKRLEIALSEKEEVFYYMTDKMSEIVIECDDKLEITFINKSGLENLNIENFENNKISITDLAIEKDKAKIEKELKSCLNGGTVKNIVFNLKNDVQVQLFPIIITNQEKQIKGIRMLLSTTKSVNYDLTELKLTNNIIESKNLYNKAVISEIAKDLIKPVKSIKNIIKLIEKTKLNEEQYNFLNSISESSETLKNLISEVNNLHLISNENNKEEKFYLTKLLSNIELNFKKTISGKNITFRITKNITKDFILYHNKTEIESILLNILDASLLQTPEGEIELELFITKQDSGYLNVNFLIKNNGKILTDLDVDKLNNSIKNFTDFLNVESTNYKFSNTIRLIKSLSGSIDFYKGRNGKNIFNFNIIIKTSENNIELENIFIDDLKNIKMLLVEDQQFNQMVIKTMTNSWDCTVDIANNGVRAIEKLKETKYNIIIMDLIMPEMDGFETSKFIRNELNNVNSKIPIVAITGNTFDDYENYDKNLFNQILSKPFTSKMLLDAIISSLSKKQLKNNENDGNLVKTNVSNGFNINVLNELTKGNAELKIKMITIFIEKYTSDIVEIEVYCEKEKWEKVYLIAHGLKPSFNYMKVGKAEKYLLDILENAKNNINTNEISILVDKIKIELNPIIITLQEEIKKLQNS